MFPKHAIAGFATCNVMQSTGVKISRTKSPNQTEHVHQPYEQRAQHGRES